MTATANAMKKQALRRPMLGLVVIVLAAQLGFAAAQLLSMVLSRELWLADLANFIRLHLMMCGIGLAAIGVLLQSRATRIGAVVALVGAFYPYAVLPQQAPSLGGQEFTLVTANVMVDNPDPSKFLEIDDVANADILVLQEVRPSWQEALIAPGLWPHESTRDLASNTDMKIFTRFPIISETRVSPESRDTGGRHASRLELQVGEQRLIVYAVHAQTPRRPAMWRERTAYFRDLQAAIVKEAHDAAVIVAGDWNTPAWSPLYRDFLAETGLNGTDPRWWPIATRYAVRFGSITQLGSPIDRVVLSPHVGLEGIRSGARFGSNHLPVVARLSLP
jgi:endonuclease/exonuclease/phosphatase (EEP) superfamily protein YafD